MKKFLILSAFAVFLLSIPFVKARIPANTNCSFFKICIEKVVDVSEKINDREVRSEISAEDALDHALFLQSASNSLNFSRVSSGENEKHFYAAKLFLQIAISELRKIK